MSIEIPNNAAARNNAAAPAPNNAAAARNSAAASLSIERQRIAQILRQEFLATYKQALSQADFFKNSRFQIEYPTDEKALKYPITLRDPSVNDATESHGIEIEHSNKYTSLKLINGSDESYQLLMKAAKTIKFLSEKTPAQAEQYNQYNISFDLYAQTKEELKKLKALAEENAIEIVDYYFKGVKITLADVNDLLAKKEVKPVQDENVANNETAKEPRMVNRKDPLTPEEQRQRNKPVTHMYRQAGQKQKQKHVEPTRKRRP